MSSIHKLVTYMYNMKQAGKDATHHQIAWHGFSDQLIEDALTQGYIRRWNESQTSGTASYIISRKGVDFLLANPTSSKKMPQTVTLKTPDPVILEEKDESQNEESSDAVSVVFLIVGFIVVGMGLLLNLSPTLELCSYILGGLLIIGGIISLLLKK